MINFRNLSKKSIAVLIAVMVVLSSIAVNIVVSAAGGAYDVWDGESVSTSIAGTGTKEDPYLIKSAADLLYISAQSAAEGSTYFAGQYIELRTNIDLAGHPFPMIKKLEGTFDGNGYEVKGVSVSATATVNGFFRYINGGTVKNLTVTGNITSTSTVTGGIVGYIDGKGAVIENCVNNINVTGSTIVGGICGNAQGDANKTGVVTITGCTNNGNVTATGAGSVQAGGFFGYVSGQIAELTITSSTNNGTVSCKTAGAITLAGFVGACNSPKLTFKYCINAGTVECNSAMAGFLARNAEAVADNKVSVINSINVGKIVALYDDFAAKAGPIFAYSTAMKGDIQTTNVFYRAEDVIYSAAGDGEANRNNYATVKTAEEFKDGTVLELLNAGLKVPVFQQGYEYPVLISEYDLWDGTSVSTSIAGTGTKEDPFLIQSAADLLYIAAQSAAEGSTYFEGQYIELKTSIDLGNHPFPMIKCLNGTFDGNGYTVKGMNVEITNGTDNNGFFRYINGGTVKNLTVAGSITSNARITGGIVGHIQGKGATIENCVNNVDVTGTTIVGGICGNAQGDANKTGVVTVTGCTNNGNITATGTSSVQAGGFFGYVSGQIAEMTITSSQNNGKISCATKGAITVAGFIGSCNSPKLTFKYCINAGRIECESAMSGFLARNVDAATTVKVSVINSINVGKIVALNDEYAAKAGPIFAYSGDNYFKGEIQTSNVFYRAEDVIFSAAGDAEENRNTRATAKTAEEFKDGTVLALLNDGLKVPVFEQGDEYPVFISNEEPWDYWDGTSASTSIAGTGTKDDPFLVQSAADLLYIAAQSAAEGSTYFEGQFIELTTNIDLGGYPFPMIKCLNGTFNGKGYEVKGMSVEITNSADNNGFFRYINGGTVKNLTVSGDITSNARITGGIVGHIQGKGATIENCVNNVNVTGTTIVGGICGNAQGDANKTGVVTVTNCVNNGNITATGTSSVQAGGFFGYVSGQIAEMTITSSQNNGKISCATKGAITVAGFIGSCNSPKLTFKYCINAGRIECESAMSGFLARNVDAATTVKVSVINSINVGKIVALNDEYAAKAGPIFAYSGNNYFKGEIQTTNVFYRAEDVIFSAAGDAEENRNTRATAKTAEEFKNGTVLALLNEGLKVPAFEQGPNYPILAVKGDLGMNDTVIREYTFTDYPADAATFNSDPERFKADGFMLDSGSNGQYIGSRLYNYGRYNNNAILAPKAEYANGNGYGVVYAAGLGSVFSFINVSDIKAERFYKFSVDAKVVDVEPEVTVKFGLYRPCADYGSLSFRDANNNTYDSEIVVKTVSLEKLTDWETYTVEISGEEILTFLDGYNYKSDKLYFGFYCPTYINNSKYTNKIAMHLDNFLAVETSVPEDYVPSANLPATDILKTELTETFGEHLYNPIPNCSFEDELKDVWANLGEGVSVQTATENDAVYGSKYLRVDASKGKVKIAVPAALVTSKNYTLAVSTRTAADTEYQIYLAASADGLPLADFEFSNQKLILSKNSENGEFIRQGVYFRNTMKTTAPQYFVIEVTKGVLDLDEITLTEKTVTATNRNYYEKGGETKIKVYDAKEKTEKEISIPFGKTIYDIVEDIKSWLK